MAPVRVERSGRVAVITIDRPERRNAIDVETSIAMNEAVVDVDEDPDVWVAIVTGAGDVFSAGADLIAIAAGRMREIVEAEPGGFAGLIHSPRRTPVIAAVNGHALAGGFEIVLACDLVVAAEDAEFALPEVARGIIAGAGGLVRLPRLIPPKRALELILTGARLPAREAYALGLVNEVAAREDVLPAAHRLAERICRNAPIAVRESRRVVEQVLAAGEDAAWAASEAAWVPVLASQDASEGPRAFAEKRAPVWTGR